MSFCRAVAFQHNILLTDYNKYNETKSIIHFDYSMYGKDMST